jgi:pyruvate,orthophosphate dikinase
MMKYVYQFGPEKTDGKAEQKNLLGGKGANLAEMARLGVPVPPGFTITTEVCTYYYDHDETYPKELEDEVTQALSALENQMDAQFGDPENPLLVSVRSGARVSMPGMMDTILNLGLNFDSVKGLAAKSGNPRFAWDSFRRLIQMYGDVVMGVPHAAFEEKLKAKKADRKAKVDADLDAAALEELCNEYLQVVEEKTGKKLPMDPKGQLWGAVGAVFGSWMNERAIVYRKLHDIPGQWGTAVNVQCMVFGNMGDNSGTGVAFTRDPATGAPHFYGEFLVNAQGEDVVAGIRTPSKLHKKERLEGEPPAMEEVFPDCFAELDGIQKKLEKHYRDMQDLEFTVQDGKLWLLQTRTGKRTGFAAFKIAADMVEEGLIDEQEALLRVEPNQLNQYLRPVFDQKALKEGKELAKGLNAGPGAATGKVALSAEKAAEMAEAGDPVILVRVETSPEDIGGMAVANGILTAFGGMTSHAALVARQLGKVCVAGCGELDIDYSKGQFTARGTVVKQGEWISISGTTGHVYGGKIDTRPAEVLQVLLEGTLDPDESATFKTYDRIMTWADKERTLGVRTNADQPDQAAQAVRFGAEGIGLCRTEHMFFSGERIGHVRRMILSDSEKARRAALEELLPMQREDFEGIFRAMGGRPVTVRTLDPPLHEFLPHDPKQISELAKRMDVSVEKLEHTIASLKEANPMLGHRGCRLALMYPEILEMQARAIIEAACVLKKENLEVKPEIMIPFVSHENELANQREIVERVANEVFAEKGVKVDYLVGTMIELPRACLVANKIAAVADFFSFGTNDLTQTTFGLSRDDSGRFLPYYVDHKIFTKDPFVAIDQEGLGQLVQMGVEKGRRGKEGLKVGICGEHGGEPSSVGFCHRTGLDYVSCSPFRVPIARLAAAQAALEEKRQKG